MRFLILSILMFIAVTAGAEERFIALDPGDPSYSQYRSNLCMAALAERRVFAAEKYWQDNRDNKIRNMTVAEREAWVEDYAINTDLMHRWGSRFRRFCFYKQ